MKSIFLVIIFFTSFAYAGHQPPDFLSAIHSQVLKDPQFNKTYIKSGCQVRAHWISFLIHSQGRTPLKYFVSTVDLNHEMKVTLGSGLTTTWIFHVAAGFKDQDGEIWVLDPVFATLPLKLEDWKLIFLRDNKKELIRFQQTGPEIYHLMDSNTQSDFERMRSPFSKEARAFTEQAMEDLFIWEKWDRKEKLGEDFED